MGTYGTVQQEKLLKLQNDEVMKSIIQYGARLRRNSKKKKTLEFLVTVLDITAAESDLTPVIDITIEYRHSM